MGGNGVLCDNGGHILFLFSVSLETYLLRHAVNGIRRVLSSLLFNAIGEMSDPCADTHLRVFQCHGCYLEMFKQANTVTKQEWDQVNVDFVEQSSVEALLHNR